MQSRDNRPQRLSSRLYAFRTSLRKSLPERFGKNMQSLFHSISLARRHAFKGTQLYLAHFPDDFVGKRLSFRRVMKPRASSCLSEAEIVCFG